MLNIKEHRVCAFIITQIAALFASFSITFAQTGNFWARWGDGRAELNGYRSTIPRYGKQRDGYSVLIFVTEDFSGKAQVKVDRALPHGELVKVMKLNHIKKFTTGIYDYSIMTSVFSPLTIWSFSGGHFKAVTPVKVSLSVQEWCGNYYEQINTTESGYKRTVHSYFDGEADRVEQLARKPHMFMEDDLFIRVRELVAPFPSGVYKMLASPMYARLEGEEIKWINARVKRGNRLMDLLTPLGSFKTRIYEIMSPSRNYTIWVEADGDKRVLKWQVKFGDATDSLYEESVITGSMRERYWETNTPGDEVLRKKLGIVDYS